MGNIDLRCESIYKVSPKRCGNEGCYGTIGFGRSYCSDYLTYMYFGLSSLPDYIHINSATLVLFNRPDCTRCLNDCGDGEYEVTPLIEYFNCAMSDYYLPRAKKDLRQVFRASATQPTIEINMTKIVSKWVDQSLDNKGIVIEGYNCSPLIICNGNTDEVESLKPFLRVLYQPKQAILPPINMPTIKLQSCVIIPDQKD